MITEPAGREFELQEVHLTEEAFFYLKDNPRSRIRMDWRLHSFKDKIINIK